MKGAAEGPGDTIRAELDRRFVAAVKTRDTQTADTIRAVRARVLEEQKKEGGATSSGDALYLQVIDKYVKQLEKALPEFDRAGAAGAQTAARYRSEIALLRGFLPKKLGEEETRALVREAVASFVAGGGTRDPRQLGRVMGALMKDHKDDLDAQLVRRLVEEELR